MKEIRTDLSNHWRMLEEDLLFSVSHYYYWMEQLYVSRAKGTTDLLFLQAFKNYSAELRAQRDFLLKYVRVHANEYRTWLEKSNLLQHRVQSDLVEFLHGNDRSFNSKYSLVASLFFDKLEKRFHASMLYAAGQDGFDAGFRNPKKTYDDAVQGERAAARDFFEMARKILGFQREQEVDRLIAFYEEESLIAHEGDDYSSQWWEDPMDVLYTQPLPSPWA